MLIDIKAIRLNNLRELMRNYETGKEFAISASLTPSQLSQLGVHLTEGEPVRKIGTRLARKIERSLNLPENWLDIKHTGAGDPDESRIKTQSIELISSIIDGFNEVEMSELLLQASIIRSRKAARAEASLNMHAVDAHEAQSITAIEK